MVYPRDTNQNQCQREVTSIIKIHCTAMCCDIRAKGLRNMGVIKNQRALHRSLSPEIYKNTKKNRTGKKIIAICLVGLSRCRETERDSFKEYRGIVVLFLT